MHSESVEVYSIEMIFSPIPQNSSSTPHKFVKLKLAQDLVVSSFIQQQIEFSSPSLELSFSHKVRLSLLQCE